MDNQVLPYCRAVKNPMLSRSTRSTFRRVLCSGVALCIGLPSVALCQTLLDASYDAGNNRLVLEIAYPGTSPDHDFYLDWGPCLRTEGGRSTIVARLIDRDGQDSASEDYRVWRTFDLAGLECRPADVTIRLGPVSNRTVSVPALPR
jgi:hypothetical protein